MFIFLTGCMAGRGVVHTVGKGETLWRICHTYGVDMQEVAEINNIKRPSDIEAGKRLFIPGVSNLKKIVPFSNASVERDKEGRIVIERDRFLWPIKGEVISAYGVRGNGRHDGIDIKAEQGTPIKAADAGEVVYVNSSLRGYGNIIILKHKDDFYTVYAHNDENLVKSGETISKGEIIGKVGSSGNATGPHLHFEVRHGKVVRNPLFFLP